MDTCLLLGCARGRWIVLEPATFLDDFVFDQSMYFTSIKSINNCLPVFNVNQTDSFYHEKENFTTLKINTQSEVDGGRC